MKQYYVELSFYEIRVIYACSYAVHCDSDKEEAIMIFQSEKHSDTISL